MKPMLASPAGPVIPFPMLLSPKLDGIAKAVYRGSKGENGMKNIDDETLFKLVEEHLNKFYKESTDRCVHGGTGLSQPAQWYRDFARAVVDVALKDLVRECEELKQQTITYARDVELLDWLEGEVCDSYTGVTINRINHREAGMVIERGFRLRRFHKDYEVKPTLRAAIAAAKENK